MRLVVNDSEIRSLWQSFIQAVERLSDARRNFHGISTKLFANSATHYFSPQDMTGNGGNKVLVFPSLQMAVVITSTNYDTADMHAQTEELLTKYVLAAIRDH